MKVRNGFVSNSSSSSFVIRGVEMGARELAGILGVDPDDEDLFESLGSKIGYSSKGVQLESTSSFFNGDDAEEVIVGISIVDLDDGCVCEIPEPSDKSDEKIRKRIEKKLGTTVGRLKTYVQYVSNDNF